MHENSFDVYIVVIFLLFKVLFYWLCLFRNLKFVSSTLFTEKENSFIFTFNWKWALQIAYRLSIVFQIRASKYDLFVSNKFQFFFVPRLKLPIHTGIHEGREGEGEGEFPKIGRENFFFIKIVVSNCVCAFDSLPISRTILESLSLPLQFATVCSCECIFSAFSTQEHFVQKKIDLFLTKVPAVQIKYWRY